MAKAPKEAHVPDVLDDETLAKKMQEVVAFIGQQVRVARTRLALTQSQIAQRANTTANQIFLIEAGRSNMTIKSLISLALILEVEPGDLLPGSSNPTARPDTSHLLSSIVTRCGRARAELDEIEGLMESLKEMGSRQAPEGV